MRREGVRARRVRAVAMACVCATAGLAAIAVAPRARSQTSIAPAPVAASTAAAPTAMASAVASAVGEQPTPHAAAVPEAPAWIDAESFAGKAFVYPPRETPRAGDARPVTVLLHGMCGEPRGACGPFVDVSTSRGWLVCPRAEDPCGGGSGNGTLWRLQGKDDARLIDASVRAVAQEHPGEVDAAAARVLVGFSLGGIAAERIAEASTGQYAGLVIVASQIAPDAARLKRAGIQRVVFAAGDLDMTSAPLRRDASRLAAQGLPTRFVSLGRFGHGYPRDMEDRMREPMTWVAAVDPPQATAQAITQGSAQGTVGPERATLARP